MKRKIGLLIPNLQAGGAERVMATISNILTSKNDVYYFVYDSTHICYTISGKLIDLKCAAKENRILKMFNFIRRVLKVAYYKHKLDLDVMISFLNAANMVNIYSRGKTRVFISCRGYSNYLAHKDDYARNINHIDKIIFQTERMRNEFLTEFSIDSKKVAVLPNPFDIYKIKDMSGEEVDQRFTSFVKGKKVLITVGSFKRDKGFWHLIKVFYLIWQKNRNVCLVIVGSRGEMENDIYRMVHRCPVKDSILFLGYQPNPFKYIARSDIYVCSSLYEGFPNAIVEAMVCGAAVVSTDCKTGPREILSSEQPDEARNADGAEYGVLCMPFSEDVDYDITKISRQHECFSDAILALLNNATLLRRYREAAESRGGEFSLHRFESRLLALIEEKGIIEYE